MRMDTGWWLLPVAHRLDVLEHGGVRGVRRLPRRDHALEEGAERVVAVVAADAEDDGAAAAQRPLGAAAVGRGRERARLRVADPDHVVGRGGLEDPERVV